MRGCINGRNLDLIDELFTTDWTYHGAAGQELQGPLALKEFLSMFFHAFPDLQVTVEDLIAEGDKVVSGLSVAEPIKES